MNRLLVRPVLLFVALAPWLVPGAARASDGTCPAGMRYFGGGTFVLADGSATVTATPFCLDATEVTAASYSACVRSGGCQGTELACSRAATYGNLERATHPINCVSWYEADTFCREAQKRLPTEAEWEWAARGGARASPFPWGAGAPGARACWDGKGNVLGKGGRKEPCPVASHPEGDSPDGLSDLAGNVREWTSSTSGRFRVVRGGSWGDSLPEFLAVAFRGMNAPDERFELTGFRCAAEPLAQPATSFARAPPATPSGASHMEAPTARIRVEGLQIDLRAKQ